MDNKIIGFILGIIVIGGVVGIGFYFYETNLLQTRMVEANNYHTQLISNDERLGKVSLTEQKNILDNDTQILHNELVTLQSISGTVFASRSQNDYIDYAISINVANSKWNDYAIKYTIAASNNNIQQANIYANEIKKIHDDTQSIGNERDSIIAAHPNEFKFQVVSN